ncbi:MAG: sulfurtransferase complex subunit TusC [Pseudomonadales bacterium]|nr:sulfurtransferase complex subunit TusC [Pseudomonadales bacterium]
MKTFLFVQHQAPHKNLVGQEGLDAVLMGSAFVNCTLLFMDDGVFQLLRSQNPDVIGRKNYPATYVALRDYGVDHIYCSVSSMDDRKVMREDLIIEHECLSDRAIASLFDTHDVILSF